MLQPDEKGGAGSDVQLRLPERGQREAHSPEGVLLDAAQGRGRAVLHAELRQRLGRGRRRDGEEWISISRWQRGSKRFVLSCTNGDSLDLSLQRFHKG